MNGLREAGQRRGARWRGRRFGRGGAPTFGGATEGAERARWSGGEESETVVHEPLDPGDGNDGIRKSINK